MLIVIISIILFVSGMMALRYQVKGESNIPFEITKISIAQSTEKIDNENTEEKWNFNVNQNNDIYIYVKKNSEYRKTEIIESVKIDNIIINKTNEIGETKIYKPVKDDNKMFINSQENEITEIIYTGELESNVKEQKISNQGGKIVFRYSINNLSKYISNEREEIKYEELLKLTGVRQEDIQTKLSFNISIKLKSNKIYQTTVELDIPTEKIIEKGINGVEIIDLQNLIFKRIEN